MKRHNHEWSPLHKRCGVDLMVRVCLVIGCEAVTDGKKILYKDGKIGRLSTELRRQMATRFTLQKSSDNRPSIQKPDPTLMPTHGKLTSEAELKKLEGGGPVS